MIFENGVRVRVRVKREVFNVNDPGIVRIRVSVRKLQLIG